MKHRYIITAVTIAGLAALYACKQEATERTQQSAEQLRQFYRTYAIRGGWVVLGINAKDKNVNVVVNVPKQQGRNLAAFEKFEQMKYIKTNACPPANTPVWGTLEFDGEIFIQARSPAGIEFPKVPCRGSFESTIESSTP